MGDVQFLTTAAGEELAVLPRAQWEALVEAAEDAYDIAESEKIRAAIASGEMEVFPGELISSLIHGANGVRAFREHRGLTAEALAAKAGISRAYLTQIESGSRKGTAATLKKLAAALGVDMELLVWE